MGEYLRLTALTVPSVSLSAALRGHYNSSNGLNLYESCFL